jgi:hypothetical protein
MDCILDMNCPGVFTKFRKSNKLGVGAPFSADRKRLQDNYLILNEPPKGGTANFYKFSIC